LEPSLEPSEEIGWIEEVDGKETAKYLVESDDEAGRE